MKRSGAMRGTALAVLLLLLDATLVESGGTHGKGGHAPLLGDVKVFGCRPEVHYVTHYRTKFQDVPVYKTITAHDLEVKPHNEVIYSTVVNVHTRSLTTTVYETSTEYLTRVSRRELTETVTRFLSVPSYVTSTKVVEQTRAVDVTTQVFNTEQVPYPVTLTELATLQATVTVPVTLVEKTPVPVTREHLIVDTSTEYQTVIHTKPAYGYGNDVIVVTENVVNFHPSYVTQTHYETSYVTHTSIQRVPTYVTHTVHAPCHSSYY
ncbi:uncharacterized protein LOC123503983 [Portunus trituberculatus]|uniref:uncharacterized protein LOC123503983 n=1 Tax=Portunus trituberculatus TaxID=210409 RepID=UPI001E1CDD6F|nr:uncharacterized protein LOC123503983 [Portunus trituberculatus]